jgi:plasmid stabilization system protein ParE
MNAPFQFTPQATEDLDAIWWFIAKDNRDAADRVEMEIIATCRRLAKHPLMGTRRQDITPLAVRFWTLPKFSNYVIVYRADNAFPALDEKAAAKLKLLYVACGTEDGLLATNRQFKEFLKAKGISFKDVETPGAHTWMVWRRNLTDIAPMLFQK